jgi:hypothetical protein
MTANLKRGSSVDGTVRIMILALQGGAPDGMPKEMKDEPAGRNALILEPIYTYG